MQVMARAEHTVFIGVEVKVTNLEIFSVKALRRKISVAVPPAAPGLIPQQLPYKLGAERLSTSALSSTESFTQWTSIQWTSLFSPVAGALVNLSLVEGRRERKRRDRKERWIERRGLG